MRIVFSTQFTITRQSLEEQKIGASLRSAGDIIQEKVYMHKRREMTAR